MTSATPQPVLGTPPASRSTPDYPAGLVGTVIGLGFAAVLVVLDLPSTPRPSGQVWGAFYIPFLLAIGYYAITEHELESKHYPAFSSALRPRWQLTEYLARIGLAAFFGLIIGLPFGVVPAGLRTPSEGYPLKCFNELEFRLCLLLIGHLLLVTWDLLVLLLQDANKPPLVRFGTIGGDVLGGLAGLAAVFLLADAADPTHRDLTGFNVLFVVAMLAIAYSSAIGKLGFVFQDVASCITRHFFAWDWRPVAREPAIKEWPLGAAQITAAIGFAVLLAAVVLAIYKSLDAWPFS